MEQQCHGAELGGGPLRELSKTVGHGGLAIVLLAVVLPRSRSGACVNCICRICTALMPGAGGWFAPRALSNLG